MPEPPIRIAERVRAMSGEGAMAVFTRAYELERQGRSIVQLEAGEPEYHPAPCVIEAAERALRAGRDRYCAPLGLRDLRGAIAGFLNTTRGLRVGAEEVAVIPSGKFAYYLAMQAMVEPGDEVLVPEPAYPAYPSVVRSLGAEPVGYALREENGLQPDLAEVAAKISPRTRVLVMCSPNNPTGTVYSWGVLEGLAELARRHDLAVVSDEIYARMVYAGGFTSIAGLEGMAERTVILDGFSKSFTMTGWRLGYAVAPRAVVRALEMLIINSFTCAPEFIQVAALAALEDRDGQVEAHWQIMLAGYRRKRALFAGGLRDLSGVHCRMPEGAFYAWARFDGCDDGEAMQERLLEEAGVAAVAGGGFGPTGKPYLRFSFAGKEAELEEGLRRIRGTMGIC
ncbi:MAG TPA: aminotransferase class I/II-fold pyridoxal phosphate-dependent enzyme [Terriglobales bacterium]|nr:aminotransferase class I/II-fold pyridoxal phosphate-dependent enzyme [Terriglobales bacterium]